MKLGKKATSCSLSLRRRVRLGAKASLAAWERLCPEGRWRPYRALRAQLSQSPRTAPGQPAAAYLTGSRHRLNQLQQLAIRLNIPGRCSQRLPSEPRARKGPSLPRAESRGRSRSEAPLRRRSREGGGGGQSQRPALVTAPARERTTASSPRYHRATGTETQTPVGLAEPGQWKPRVDVLTFLPGAEGPPQAPPMYFSNHHPPARGGGRWVAEGAGLPVPREGGGGKMVFVTRQLERPQLSWKNPQQILGKASLYTHTKCVASRGCCSSCVSNPNWDTERLGLVRVLFSLMKQGWDPLGFRQTAQLQKQYTGAVIIS